MERIPGQWHDPQIIPGGLLPCVVYKRPPSPRPSQDWQFPAPAHAPLTPCAPPHSCRIWRGCVHVFFFLRAGRAHAAPSPLAPCASQPHATPPHAPCADYLCDVADSLEAEVQRLCDEQQKRARGRVSRRDGAGGAGAASAAKASAQGPTDSALHAEIATGADLVWGTMLQAYELVGDQFEVYAHRNVFAWPEGLDFSVRAARCAAAHPAHTLLRPPH
jgi:hypothetical protein